MRTRISKMSLIVFCVLLLLSGFLMSVPGDYWPWYAIMSAFALVPCAAGQRWYRLAGFGALALSVALIASDYKAGREFRLRLERLHNQAVKVDPTNGEPDGPAKGSQPIRSETNRTSGAAPRR